MLTLIHDYWQFLLIGEYPDGPLGGLALTLAIACVSLVMTFPVGLVLALARTSAVSIFRRIATVYVYLVRGMPLLTFLLWIYFLVPLVLSHPITPFWTLVLAIVLYQSAYLSEVIRGGIEGLPPGQMEAAKSLGLSYGTTMRKVVLPQALFNVIPGIVNQFTIIIKESSLGSIIALAEVTFVAGRINSFLLTEALNVFFLLAVIYFIICFSLSLAVSALEKRVAQGRTNVEQPIGGELVPNV